MSYSAAVDSLTPNYNFRLINFAYPRWHTEEWKNWQLLDATLRTIGVLASQGIWENSTAYVIGDRVVDTTAGIIYQCLVGHTSAASPDTFEDDRTAHPTYWQQITTLPNYRGAWVTATSYNIGDIIVRYDQTWYYCLISHTSGTFGTDLSLAKWTTVFDVSSYVNTYYGARTSETNLRNDGTASQAGDIYYNSMTSTLRLFSGTVWTNFSASGSTASGITFTPAGDIASTDVQGALAELANEKVKVAGDTMTGNLQVNARIGIGSSASLSGSIYIDVTNGTNSGTAIARVYQSGTNGTASFTAQTATANSTFALRVYDNTGSPYGTLEVGSALSGVYLRGPAFTMQNLGGTVSYLAAGDGSVTVGGSTTATLTTQATSGAASNQIKSSGTNSAYLILSNVTNSERVRIYADDSRNLYISVDTGSTNQITVTATGVGIGNITPAVALEVATGTGSTTDAFKVRASTHASSRRAAILLDNWRVAQDSAANGTKNFYIYDVANTSVRFSLDATNGSGTFSRSIQIGSPTGGDKGAGTLNAAGDIYVNGSPIVREVTVRQTVMGGPVDSSTGLPTFLPATSVNLDLTTQNISSSAPFVVSAANGFSAQGALDRIGYSTANLTWTGLTASKTNYLYVDVGADGTLTTGFTTVAPTYQYGGSRSTTANISTFNITEMYMTTGNGSAAVQGYRVYVGEAVTSGSAVTSTVAYAYNGYYDFLDSSNLPTISTTTTKSHNIGVPQVHAQLSVKCVTNDTYYSVGDEVYNSWGTIGGIAAHQTWLVTSKTYKHTTNSSSAWSATAGGGGQALTAANWRMHIVVKRDW